MKERNDKKFLISLFTFFHMKEFNINRFLMISNIYNESKIDIFAFVNNNCNLQTIKYNRFLERTA